MERDMKQYRLQLTAAIMMVVALVALAGWAGDMDFCDQVILNMTQEQYDHVKDTLEKMTGKQPSDRDIAHWWADHHCDE